MKVLIYNRKGYVKYVPLVKATINGDFDINEKIMPPNLFKKLKTFCNKRDEKRGWYVNKDLPIYLMKRETANQGREIVTMNKSQYESKKNEIV
jgi:hypothetical protein